MDLRDKETATAVQDLEIRQMELEVQRKRLEQVINIFLHLHFYSFSSSVAFRGHLFSQKNQIFVTFYLNILKMFLKVPKQCFFKTFFSSSVPAFVERAATRRAQSGRGGANKNEGSGGKLERDVTRSRD